VISETLKLEVDGTAKVNALAKSLERYAKAHAAAAALPQIPFGDAPSAGSGRVRGGGGGSPRSGAGDVGAARAKAQREADEKHVAGIKDRYFAQQQREEERAAAQAVKRHEQGEKAALKDVERRAAAESKAKRRVIEEKQSGHLIPTLDGLADVKAGIDIITGAAEKAYAVVSRVVGAAFGAGKAVLDAQAFKEDTIEALTVVAGGADAARALMDRASVTADKLGRQRGEVSRLFLDLTTKGFNADMTDRIVRSIADLTTIDPNASAEGITKVIGKAQAQGRINLDILSELNTFGLEQGDVIKEIRKITRKNDVEVLKALSGHGGIRGLGVEPILAAINKQVGGGEAGAAAMAKSRRNLSSLMQQVQDIPAKLLFDLDAGPGVDKVKGTLREIIEFFDTSSKSGKDVRQVLGDTFNAIAEGLFGIDTSKAGGITEVLQSILEVVKGSKSDIRDFAAAIRMTASGLASLFALLEIVQKGPDAQIWKDFGDGFAGVVGQMAGYAGELWDAGANLITSLAGGITSSAQSVIDAVTSSVGGAISWAKQLLGIASPSKVFTQIGAYTSQGFAQGIAQNDNAVSSAAGAMAQRAIGGAAGAAFPSTAAPGGIAGAGQAAGAAQQGAGGSMISIGSITVHVTGGKGVEAAEAEGRAAARAFREQLDAELPGALRRVA